MIILFFKRYHLTVILRLLKDKWHVFVNRDLNLLFPLVFSVSVAPCSSPTGPLNRLQCSMEVVLTICFCPGLNYLVLCVLGLCVRYVSMVNVFMSCCYNTHQFYKDYDNWSRKKKPLIPVLKRLGFVELNNYKNYVSIHGFDV